MDPCSISTGFKPAKMTYLDSRSRDVLMILLQSQTPIVVRQIAAELEITPRMIRASLDTIQTWLQERGVELVRKTNYGVQVQASASRRSELIGELNEKTGVLLYLSPVERVNVLVLMLLRDGAQPLPTEVIESTLGISHPTLLKDVEKARLWLDQFHLTLEYRPRSGFQLHGSEADWREALVHLFILRFGVVSLLALGEDPGSRPQVRSGSNLNLLSTMLSETLQVLDLGVAHTFVKRLEELLHRRFVDVAFVRLTCHLALALHRSALGKSVDLNGSKLDNPTSPAVQAVAQLLDSAPFALNESETVYFIRQVRGAKTQYTLADNLQFQAYGEGEPETQTIVQAIVDDASRYLHPYLKVDQQLMRALSHHILVTRRRMRYGLPVDNPLQEAIEARYPYIVSVAAKSLASLDGLYPQPAPPAEIAYIAMHLGAAMERLRPNPGAKRRVWVVCGEGTATSWLLVSRLQAEFPEIEILEVLTALEVTKSPPQRGQVDLVLTTLPIEIPHVVTLEVSPLLPSEDQARIRAAIHSVEQQKIPETAPAQDPAPLLASLFSEETIALHVKVENWLEVVDVAGGLLHNRRAISSRYIEAMKDVIYRYGPYVVFTPGVALLHARPEDGVHRMCMSLVTLDPPVAFHHPHNDPVHLAFALGVVDNHSHLKALGQLADLLNDRERLSRIQAASTQAEVLALLAQTA